MIQENLLKSRENIRSLPHFILLNEPNLSFVKYYWADFMNLCFRFLGGSDIWGMYYKNSPKSLQLSSPRHQTTSRHKPLHT